jgi:diguanylate cyclase (GGDEF)-like protein
MNELGVRVAEHVGAVIGRTGRGSDAIGRLGQAEFAIIAPATEAAGAERFAQRVQELVEALPFHTDGDSASVRVRAGYYAVPDFAESSVDVVEMLVRAADALRQTTAGATGPSIRQFGGVTPPFVA